MKNIYFEQTEKNVAFRKYYEDVRLLGKHFRVEYKCLPSHSRHYTICNVMEKGRYDTLCSALEIGSYKLLEDNGYFNSDPTNFMRFTVKNYNLPKGLST